MPVKRRGGGLKNRSAFQCFLYVKITPNSSYLRLATHGAACYHDDVRFSGLFVVALSIALLNSCSQIAQLLPSYFTRMTDGTINEVEEEEEPHRPEDEEEDMDESLLDDPEPEPEPTPPAAPTAKSETPPARADQNPAEILPSAKQMEAAYKWIQEQQKDMLPTRPQTQQPQQPPSRPQTTAPAAPNTPPHVGATPAAMPAQPGGIPTPPSTGLRTAPYIPYQNEQETPSPARIPDPAQQRGLRSPGLPKLLPMDFDGKIHS